MSARAAGVGAKSALAAPPPGLQVIMRLAALIACEDVVCFTFSRASSFEGLGL